jgi:hypothetical protein
VFVPLAGVTEPERAVIAFGRVVGADLRDRFTVQAVIEPDEDRWLLILDNPSGVEVASTQRPVEACSGVAMLATSLTAAAPG